jgi:hypothetical protein
MVMGLAKNSCAPGLKSHTLNDMNRLEYTVKMSRISVNGKEVKNPVFLFVVTFFPQALGAVLMAMFLTKYMPVFPAIFIALIVFYNFGLIAFLLTISHPILRLLGRRGFIQDGDQQTENYSRVVADKSGRIFLKLTTVGALGRK